MKKLIFLTIVLAVSLTLTACFSSNAENSSTKPKIVVSLFPQYDFVKQISKDKYDVSLLMEPGTDTHSYEPKASDIRKINEADIFIYSGQYMDKWLTSIFASINGDNLQIIDISKGIKLDEVEVEVKGHGEGDHADDHAHYAYDPHIWTSPKNVVKIVDTIYEGLVNKFPDDKDFLSENKNEYVKQIENLDKKFTSVAESLKGKKVVFAGKFPFHYLFKDYGIDYIAAFDFCAEEAEPNAKKMAEIITYIKNNNTKAIYHEENASMNVPNQIKAETGAEILLLHSVHSLSSEDFQKGLDYVSLMQQNIENLKKGI